MVRVGVTSRAQPGSSKINLFGQYEDSSVLNINEADRLNNGNNISSDFIIAGGVSRDNDGNNSPLVSALAKISSVRIVPAANTSSFGKENSENCRLDVKKNHYFKLNCIRSIECEEEAKRLGYYSTPDDASYSQLPSNLKPKVKLETSTNNNVAPDVTVLSDNNSGNHCSTSAKNSLTSVNEKIASSSAVIHHQSLPVNATNDAPLENQYPSSYDDCNVPTRDNANPTEDVNPPTILPTRIESNDAITEEQTRATPEVSSVQDRREERRLRRERRRERRARRLQEAVADEGVSQRPPPVQTTAPSNTRLPDLLNSHVPPPYSTLPGSRTVLTNLTNPPAGFPAILSNSVITPYPEPMRHRDHQNAPPGECDPEDKVCCGLMVTQAVSMRWFIIMIAFVGLCCTIVGTVLGAIKTHNADYVTITLLMIGVGIVLITVSGVAWHLTSRDAPCRVMLGLSPPSEQFTFPGDGRRFMGRGAPFFGRPQYPYSAMMYPGFPYRPPPPSYQASMQEYRLRLLLMDRTNPVNHPHFPPHPVPPPPSYRTANQTRGNAANTDTIGRDSTFSQPPSYRSREGSISQNPDINRVVHSRNQSCLSFASHDSAPSSNPPSTTNNTLRVPNTRTHKQLTASDAGSVESGDRTTLDGNKVTIVQTTNSSKVIGNQSVTVTVSGDHLAK